MIEYNEWTAQDPDIDLHNRERAMLVLLDNPAFCYHCGQVFKTHWVDFDYHADFWHPRKNYAICLRCKRSYHGFGPEDRVGGTTQFDLAEILQRLHPESGPGRRERELAIGSSRKKCYEHWNWWAGPIGAHRIGPPEEASRKRALWMGFVTNHIYARPGRELPPRLVQNRGEKEQRRRERDARR